MVDYTKQLGSQSGSKMMIRDLGQTVELWVMSGSAGTYGYNFPFGWTANSYNGTGTFDYNVPWDGRTFPTPGPWVKLKTLTIEYSQTITLRIGATGTTGLDGPAEFSKYIERATARINVNGTWKTAIPYVKKDGVWKVAQAWIKSSGVWKVGG